LTRHAPLAAALVLMLALPLPLPQAAAGQVAAGRAWPCTPPPAVLPLAPPIDAPLRFTITTERPASNGAAQRFALEYEVGFYPVGRGLGMTATLVRIDAPQGMAAGGAMRAIFAPLLQQPVDLLVDSETGALALRDGDALWRRLADDMATRAARGPDEGRALSSALLALPRAEREAMLVADLALMLRFGGRTLVGGGTLAAMAGRPPDRTADCAIILDEDATDTAAGGNMRRKIRWQIDPATGLVHEQSEERWLIPAVSSQTVRSLTRKP
jgi:hypothetical protein